MAYEAQLPSEIISHIISFIPRSACDQHTLWACCLVSRAWYSASITPLYEKPYLNGSNFDQFVTTVCPSKNAHLRASPLSTLVRHLNMGGLVHDASRSLTARLLGRLKGNLEFFVAPQVSFAINSLAALSKCTKLRHLNLSLISSSITNKELFQALKSLVELETLFLPRSLHKNEEDIISEPYIWPPRLVTLYVGGGVGEQFFFSQLARAPKTVSRLIMQHCPQISVPVIIFTLFRLGTQLKHLSVHDFMTQLLRGMLDNVLELCPNLTSLRVSVDYVSAKLFTRIPPEHPLRLLELGCSQAPESDITPNLIFDAIDQDFLPDLRCVRVSKKLEWETTPHLRTDVKDLSDFLDALEAENPLHEPSGVWFGLSD
ncbi:F-box protein [Golovinomyces cichoracearum]|uniref:F-box protein n=1 Tax=Golovinomyces cichoracearum TaxID=62708 RepID=A0A420HQ01_9PEZI|nr:F-box protein [Golovinomyces cichoracearum]